MKTLLKPATILALIYCLIGPALLFIEAQIAGREALRQALPIALIAAFFFVYSVASLGVFRMVITKKSSVVMGYYLCEKLLRLLLSVLIIIVYGLFVKVGLLPFAINVLIFYLTTMAFTGYYYIREERNHNKANA